MPISRPIEEKLNKLTEVLGRLLGNFRELRGDYERVVQENGDQKAMIQKLRYANKNLQNQANISNIVVATDSEIADIQAIKAKIDACIAELDHCINTLTES
jgi:hypothetical protein